MSADKAYQPNFYINLPYRNKLPNAPYGPYFKTIDTLSNLKSVFPEYRTSTIEKNYIWQPHFGPDVGINIDLVDQDSILVADDKSVLHPDDKRYLAYSANEKGKGKLKTTFDQQSKPWWLRNTTYLENNPFNRPSNLKEEDPKLRAQALKKKLANPNLDHFSHEYVEKTFISVEETIKRLQQQNTNKKLVSCVPILPLVDKNDLNGEDSSYSGNKRLHSLVRYDEDPKAVMNIGVGGGNQENAHSNTIKIEVNGDDELPPEQLPSFKKYRIEESIITNLRDPVIKDETDKLKGLEVTLVAPAIKIKEEPNSNEKKKEGEGEQLYEWVKDYRMEVNSEAAGNHFIVILDENKGTFEYFPLKNRIDMKKLTLENSIPQDFLVVREDSR